MIKLWQNLRLNRYFLLGVLIFGYLKSIQARISFSHPITFYTFTPEAAAGSFISACIIFMVVHVQINSRQKWLVKPGIGLILQMLLTSILIFLSIFNLILLLVALGFGTVDRNFTWPIIARNNLDAALDVCMYGGFYMAYWYYQKSKEDSIQLTVSQQALSDSKIAQLKAQLNPHFLFNNLNILDQLIEEDPARASGFLHDFAELYRYSLQTSGKKLVTISEELHFARSYFRLIEYKYDRAYSLNADDSILKASDKYIPPFTLQLLIENAVEHNLGTNKQPVHIRIKLSGNFLTIVNNRIKATRKTQGGRSLRNLQEQYALLTSSQIQILGAENEFRVQIPIIQETSYD